jgi:metallo-beta-lactamase class B
MKGRILIFLVVLTRLSLPAQINDTIKVGSDIELIKISEHAYVHISYYELPDFGRFPSNGLILVNQGQAMLFDTPWTDSLTRELVGWLNDSLQLKLVAFIPNHWHPDCMGGLAYLQSIGVESYANQMTIDLARANNLPVSEHGFEDSLKLNLGDMKVECYYLGAAHSLDNIVVWIPAEKILFPGCMVRSLYSKSIGNTRDGDLFSYPRTIDKLLARFPLARYVIPGHGQFGGPELIRYTRELLEK